MGVEMRGVFEALPAAKLCKRKRTLLVPCASPVLIATLYTLMDGAELPYRNLPQRYTLPTVLIQQHILMKKHTRPHLLVRVEVTQMTGNVVV